MAARLVMQSHRIAMVIARPVSLSIAIAPPSRHSICAVAGDNSLLPQGLKPLFERVAELGLLSRDGVERILEKSKDHKKPRGTGRKISESKSLEDVIYVKGRSVDLGSCAQVSSDEAEIEIRPGKPVRLSKRMSELGICSRREAARMLKMATEVADEKALKHIKEVVYLRGHPVTDGAAVKVHPGENHIEIRAGDDPPNAKGEFKFLSYADRPWEEIRGDTIVLNKPVGYVSGQEEHQHVPAVRLLTRSNMYLGKGFDDEDRHEFGKGGLALNFERWKYSGFDLKKNSVPRRIRSTLGNDGLGEKNGILAETLSGYAVAGRLDIDSTGVLIFSRAGVMARHIINPKSLIPKEYVVRVRPAYRPTARELEMGLSELPPPTRDLSLLLKRGNWLWNDPKPLKPLLAAEWLAEEDDSGKERVSRKRPPLTMRLVLVEGKKRQIRRMCREILGWHVVDLVRTSLGPVTTDSLPEGRWRPLTREEVKAICCW